MNRQRCVADGLWLGLWGGQVGSFTPFRLGRDGPVLGKQQTCFLGREIDDVADMAARESHPIDALGELPRKPKLHVFAFHNPTLGSGATTV